MTKLDVINPKPSFVIKGKLQIPYKQYPASTKIFINVLTDPIVPKPEHDFNAVDTFPLIMENKWEIAIYNTSTELKTVLDKKGVTSLYLNCIINTTCMKWCMLNQELLTILMEWCIESVEFQLESDWLMIDRDTITTPKMTYKGDPNDIVDLEVDLDAIQSVNKNFEEDEDLMVVDTSEPLGLLLIKRLEIASQELEDDQEVIPVDEFLGKLRKGMKKPLIEVIEDTPVATAKVEEISYSDEKDELKPKLQINVTLSKLSPNQTKDSYKLLIKFQSLSSDYDLKFDNKNKDIQLTTADSKYSKSKSLVKFPLPTDITGDIKSFYNESDNILYVYIK